MSALATIGVWVGLLVPWGLLRAADAARGGRGAARPDAWAVGLWAAVAAGAAAQAVWPALLAWGQRDPAAIRAGEWWRLGTAIFLQDGGLAGTIFNLATLAVSLVLVGTVRRGPTAVAWFLAGGVVSNALAAAGPGTVGAGSSMATLFLLAATMLRARPWRVARRATAGALALLVATAVVLVADGDPHGGAMAAGLAAGALELMVRPAGGAAGRRDHFASA